MKRLVLLLALLCISLTATQAMAMTSYENCQVMGMDIRNGNPGFVQHKNKELWKFVCQYPTTNTVVKVCLDSTKAVETPAFTYDMIEAILQDRLANPAKRVSIWVDQATPPTNFCYGYWSLTRICTLTNCYSDGSF